MNLSPFIWFFLFYFVIVGASLLQDSVILKNYDRDRKSAKEGEIEKEREILAAHLPPLS